MKTFKLSLVSGLAFYLFSGAQVLAQNEAESIPPAPPPFCETAEGFSDFDFWVGEWNVYSNDDEHQFAGTNSITKHYNNCLIKETWQGAGGGGGFSINYYNAVTDVWRQVWVANGYSIDYTGGLNENGAMVLEGEIYGYRSGNATPFKGTWTPQADGSVVQHFDIYDAANDIWNVWFEGLYIRKENDTREEQE